MNAYIFFSIHEKVFDPIARGLKPELGINNISGFVWGKDQRAFLEASDVRYQTLTVFTEDVKDKPLGNEDARAIVEERETRYGFSVHRMLFAERHLLKGKSYPELLELTAKLFLCVEDAYDRAQPDFVFSEDISCLTSFIHFVVAQHRNIPYLCIGSARVPGRVMVYSKGIQRWEHTQEVFARLLSEGLDDASRAKAESFLSAYRKKPERPTGMETRARLPGLGSKDLSYLLRVASRYRQDPESPVLEHPAIAMRNRLRRIGRIKSASALKLFETPARGEKYVVYPIHFQPEASTLVQAPFFLDQVSLIEDIAKSLPAGHCLYVKEHLSNRGRRPLSFYRRIKEIPAVRLLGPDVDTWSLVQNAAAITVITGTMGWEGVLFRKPVLTFGDVFYNNLSFVHKASACAKQDWPALFRRAIFEHQHHEEELLCFLSAIFESSDPGFLKNPNTFPQVSEQDNVDKLIHALARAVRRIKGNASQSVQPSAPRSEELGSETLGSKAAF